MVELLISGISLIVCSAIWTIPKLYFNYKTETLKECENTSQQSIILAQKIADKEKEEQKTKQLEIKANFKEKYNERLY